MAAEAPPDDRGVGLTVLLTLVALGAALGMYVAAPAPLAGWAFAAAVTAGALAVAAAHVYWA